MSGYFIARTPEQLMRWATEIVAFPVLLTCKLWDQRTKKQNATLHLWCTEAAKFFIEGGKHEFMNGDEMNMENMKKHLKHTFLGSIPIQKIDLLTGEVTIEHETRSSAALDKGEMIIFLDQIRAWAAGFDLALTVPIDSSYYQYLQEQGEMV